MADQFGMHTTLRYLLLALTLSASADDLWAAVTPDPADDVAAAEDNDYPPAARRPGEIPPRDTADTPLVVVGKTDSAHLAVIFPAGRLADTDCRPFYCPDLLYTFMSLQR